MNELNDDQLLQAYLDRRLSPQETARLEERLCREPELAEQLIEFASDDLVLREWAADQDHVFGLLTETEFIPETDNLQPRPTVRRLWYPVVAVASLLILLTGGYLLKGTFQLKEAEAVVLSSGERVQNHIRQVLAEGSAELHFPTGATVLISAPAAYEVTGKNSIHLQEGKFIANVPSTGIGFQVDTPHGRVIDLGTLFSVQTAETEDTRVEVFRGKVIASLVDPAGVVSSSRQLDEHQSAKIDSRQKRIEDTPDFRTRGAQYGIKGYSNSVIFQEELPEALATGKYQVFEHDDLAFIFPERSQVELPRDLSVLVSPTPEEQLTENKLHYPILLPAGTKVDCFRVYYDPALKEGTFLPVQGEIEFARPVLGVILEKKKLNRTDVFFHPPVKQSAGDIYHQGTEVDMGIVDPKARYDQVMLSADRKTLSFVLLSGEKYVDEFRVIVESAD
ncbi:FecR domain-containing protein [Gimesia chilikensis]|uniref:FecR domain-containing protein n=1 Tax=Gimesia chilikensis TaxID=2605989 RepID=UPI0016592F0B|nr:FecR domain-containing protein [Gimesia chilikensis]